ncbi:flagellar basal-body rod protein FlgB [Oxalobacteraceae bacterium GrIS 2.11]
MSHIEIRNAKGGEAIMASGLDELLNVQQSALRVRESRQSVLASNLANADTPNYKARDIDFKATLQQVVKGRQSSAGGTLPLAATSAAHLKGKATESPGAAVQYRNEQQGSIDGNNVDVDRERMQFGGNDFNYQATVTLITAQIRGMLAVIQS